MRCAAARSSMALRPCAAAAARAMLSSCACQPAEGIFVQAGTDTKVAMAWPERPVGACRELEPPTGRSLHTRLIPHTGLPKLVDTSVKDHSECLGRLRWRDGGPARHPGFSGHPYIGVGL